MGANICFEYIYRDAANYKNWGSVIFSGQGEGSLSNLEERIRNALIDTEFFVAEEANLPTLYFSEFDPEIDHTWHQFASVHWTSEQVSATKASNT